MKLISLKLRNFKGIKEFTLITGGNDISVFGENGTGKTTIFDAFTFLLFNKDSMNRADFEIKTLDANGEPVHGLEHEVEGTLDLDGKALTLRKAYSENWTKKRGQATKEFTSHSTAYYLDGVPVKKNEYEASIASIVDEDAFKLLTNPRHFNEILHWQERRKILLEVCGDVSDDEVISSDSKLAKLPDILDGRKLEDHRKIVQAKRTEINKELERIPVRIDEAQRGLPEATETTALATTSELADLKRRRSEESALILRMESGGEVAEKVKQLREVEAELLEIQKGYWTQTADKTQSAKVELRELKDKASDFEITIKSSQRLVSENQVAISSIEREMERLRQDWQEVNAREFTFEQSDTCPTCGQALPTEQVEAARGGALAGFNRSKANNLEEITNEGKLAKSKVEKLREENADVERKTAMAQAKLTEVESQVTGAEGAVVVLEEQESDYTKDEAYIKKQAQKEDIERRIEALKAEGAGAIEDVRHGLGQIDGQIDEIEHTLAQIEQRQGGLKRIEELKGQERQLATEYERMDSELYLTEQFVRAKVRLLEERINSRFKHARFRLFEEQVNGAIAECCETTYQGIPYSSALNNSARINIGLDIINTLSEHYQLTAPIWMDNAEAVTALIPTTGQQIKLYVSEADKVLRIES